MTKVKESEKNQVSTYNKEPLKMQVKVIIPYMLIVSGIMFVLGIGVGYFGGINLHQDARADVVADMHTASK